jgi:hypothetical protein
VLKSSFETIDDSGFWSFLEEYIALLVPIIECSSILQSADATLADIVFCRCRQYGRLLDARKSTALNALERRWSQIAVFLQPKYQKYLIQMRLFEEDIGRLVLGYAKRWGSPAAWTGRVIFRVCGSCFRCVVHGRGCLD